MATGVDRRLSTGVDRLDRILDGGLLAGQTYMVRGDSGTGKTILGQHFLSTGVGAGERALYVAFEERPEDLVGELHALCRYLRNMGVTVVLTEEIHSVTGEFRASDSHVSYLADTVIFLRYLEQQGRMEKAIGVLKRRLGGFDPTVRSLTIDDGYHLGDASTGGDAAHDADPGTDGGRDGGLENDAGAGGDHPR